MSTEIESLISIYTIDQGKIKILLVKNVLEPYKGYWRLPGSLLKQDESLENNITDVVYDELGFTNLNIEQCHTFSDTNRIADKRVIAVNFMSIIDYITASIKRVPVDNVQSEWFSIDELPKLMHDHEVIINNSLKALKNKLANSNSLKSMFPSDFTLPEIQKVYEKLFDMNIDRRNFRKRFIKFDMIEETGEYSDSLNGRPAKLYRFKENIKSINLF